MTRNISIGIVVVVALVAGGWWYLNKSNVPLSETQTPTLQESTNTTTQAPIKLSTPTTQTTSPSPTTGTANWKTYRSEKWGIEFKYPSNFVLNTSPNAYWKDFGPYRDGYDFFELVDAQRGCYVGPVKAVGMNDSSYTLSNKSIGTSGRSLEVKYWLDGGAVFIGQANLLAPDSGPWLSLNVTSLSNGLIESNYKNASADRTVSENCVKDFETILTTVKFTN